MSSVLTILGGSSPFTAALVDAIRDRRPSLQPRRLVLYGRNSEHLSLVARYAQTQLEPLGWTVRTSINLVDALEGASTVIHQIRYGGMKQRAEDERLAEAHGLAADETLGPAGLRAAIGMAPALKELALRIRECCPMAWVLNLTNPVSTVTALLALGGLSRCVGLCELPLVTTKEACRILGLPIDAVEWSYSGLNHRGFIHALHYQGTDYLAELPLAVGNDRLGGIDAETIAELGALPLKYFRLVQTRFPYGGGRAAYLSGLRKAVFEELKGDGATSPPSLRKRSMEWYPQSVVPMLAALEAGDGRIEVINIPMDGGCVRELRAKVFAGWVEPVPTPRPGAAVQRWLEVFSNHERAVLAAALEPSRQRVAEALAADPIVPASAAESLIRTLIGPPRIPTGVSA